MPSLLGRSRGGSRLATAANTGRGGPQQATRDTDTADDTPPPSLPSRGRGGGGVGRGRRQDTDGTGGSGAPSDAPPPSLPLRGRKATRGRLVRQSAVVSELEQPTMDGIAL